jgi:uncharacterized Zn finger protein (UPF0148 family)
MEAEITSESCPYCSSKIVQAENGETFCINGRCTYNTSKAKLKYKNVHVEADNYKFDSKAERNRYHQLKYMQKEREISDLKVHPVYELLPDFTHEGKIIKGISYEADFSYMKNGKLIVEDVKGVKTDVFKLKYKMFINKYPEIQFIIKEINSGKKGNYSAV